MSTDQQENIPDLSLFGEADPLVGTVLLDRFEVLQFLGEGSLSSVYLVRDKEHDGKSRVLKRIHAHLLESVKNLAKFQQRCQALCNISSKHILTYREIVLTPDGRFFLLLDDTGFESLEEILSKSGHVPVERAVEIFKQVCKGLEDGSKSKIEHRDIKPSNIAILDNEQFTDEIKILDFGIARLLADESQNSRSAQYITQGREVFGSPLYLSPEQCTGKRLDERSDIYSLGCVMYEAVTGKPPFVGKNVLETAYKHMNEPPKAIEIDDGDQTYLKRMETVIFKCLEKEPVFRYQNISDLRQDLDLIFTEFSEDWQQNANAFKSRPAAKLARRGLPISSEILLFAFMSVIVLCAASFLVTSGSSTSKVQYPPYDDSTLWVVDREARDDSESEGFGTRQDAAKDALELVKEEQGEDSEDYAAALSNLVELYANSGHWEQAEVYTRDLIDVCQKVKGPWPLSDCYRILGYVCFMQDKKEPALEACEKAVALMENNPTQQRTMLQPLRVIGDICARKGDLDKGVATYEKLFSIVDILKESNPSAYSDTASKLADMYRRQEKYADGERYYKLGIDWAESHDGGDSAFMAKSYYGLAMCQIAQSKFEEARVSLDKGIPVAKIKIGPQNALTGAMIKQQQKVLWRVSPLEAIKNQLMGSSSKD